RAVRTATVTISALGLEVTFAAGEEVRTEISAKFTRDRLEGDYAAAGLRLVGWWTDPDDLFAVSLAAPGRNHPRIDDARD
ncbi:MAG: L-histidine N(alpha)-methyltransferase, partial [Solirubrobacteraceae bacterium]